MIHYNIFSPYSSSRESLFFWRAHVTPCFELSALSFRLEAFLNLAKIMIGCLAKAAALVLLFLVLLLPCVVRADVSVSIKLDRKEATLADSVQMVVSVSGSRSSDLQPMVRGLEAFNVTQGGTASRLEIINGKANAGVDYTYFIQPKKSGEFQILQFLPII